MNSVNIHRVRIIKVAHLWDGKSYFELIESIVEAARMNSLYSFLHYIVYEHNAQCKKLDPVATEDEDEEPDVNSVSWVLKRKDG